MKETENKIKKMIQSSGLFGDLSAEEIESIVSHVEIVELEPHSTLFFQGDLPDGIFILLEGELKAFLVKPSGKILTVGHVYPVEIVGELGALSGEPRSMTVEAVEHCVGLRLTMDMFRVLCEKHHSLLKEISNRIVQRSIKNIKFMTHEVPVKNVVIIYPLVDQQQFKFIKEMVKKYLQKDDIIILSTDEVSIDTIKNNIQEAEESNKMFLVLLHQWDDVCIHLAGDYPVKMMVMLEVEAMHSHREFIRSSLGKLSDHPTFELDLVLLHPPKSRQNKQTASFLRLAHFKAYHHITIGNVEDYERLYRFITGKAIALVLGGGGGRGLMHVGLFKALAEKKIKVDAIGGTSIGAGMAACYAATNGSYEETCHLVGKIKDAMLVSLAARNLVWPVISVYSGNPITDTMESIFGDSHIEDLQIPYFAISADLDAQQEIVHDHGLIWKAVRASGSIPAIFPPMVVDGRLLLDGGLLNNLPVDVMREKIGGEHIIIAASLSKVSGKKTHHDFPPTVSLRQSTVNRIMGKKITYPSLYAVFRDSLLLGSSSAENKNAHAADILIRPNLDKFNTIYVSPTDEEKLIEIGYRHGLEMLENFFSKKKSKL